MGVKWNTTLKPNNLLVSNDVNASFAWQALYNPCTSRLFGVDDYLVIFYLVVCEVKLFSY